MNTLIEVIDRLDQVDDSDRFNPRIIFAEGESSALPTARALVCPGDEEGTRQCPLDSTLRSSPCVARQGSDPGMVLLAGRPTAECRGQIRGGGVLFAQRCLFAGEAPSLRNQSRGFIPPVVDSSLRLLLVPRRQAPGGRRL